MSVEIFREILCKKTGDTSNFLECEGKLCAKCLIDGYCNATHLSEKQHAYLDSDIHSSIYLKACPGSGKTEVLGVKCAMEIERWSIANSGIAVLTFTNSAEDEMKSRISLYSSQSIGYPHYVGTFTSWLHGYIANPFLYKIAHNGCDGKTDSSLRIVDSDCISDFLNAFKTKYSYGQRLHNISGNAYHWDIKANKYIFSGNNNEIVSIFDSEYLSKSYMKGDLRKTKEKFWKSGFFTYEDVEYLSYLLLLNNSDIADFTSKRFPVVIVDECQDLSYAQLRILEILHKYGTAIHLIGDLNQAIYEFRQIDTNDTSEFVNENELSEMILDENYRSNQKIVDASVKIIQSESLIIGKQELIVSRPLIAILYKDKQEQKLVNYYSTILNEEGLQLNESRIVVRNNSLKNKILGKKTITGKVNTIEDFAHFVYLRKTDSLECFRESIRVLARAIQRAFFANEEHGNSNILYKPGSLEPSQWNAIIVSVQKRLLTDSSVNDLNKTWSVWKKALASCLRNIDVKTSHGLDLKKIRPKMGDKIVVDTFSNSHDRNISITIETIHGCKGMSLDSVLFVSSYKKSDSSSGAHWRDWFQHNEAGLSEAQRLAYVAFSRAKHLLALGIPNPPSAPLTEADRNMLIDYGFEIVEIAEE
ncbi:hypothetical protein RASY3_13285 [Ruminococcus albus SY3]|uniref:DNA 3'-5' helicase n=1 Tax=Ruminococcus albus SY3 TaxID=1341156 RepID=A0A011UCU2_RUMAL|nr:DEAD/DEAH box helicase [Ruminococcus albus]EXM38434.1 hypothetical protein RASY3_13285 [Ruminococcus albus SY3]